MIRLRLTVKPGQGTEFPIQEGELLDQAVARSVGSVPLEGREPKEIFSASVNGMPIHSDLWPVTKLRSTDQVLVSPTLKGDDPESAFRTVFVIAATVAATVILTPAGGATIASSLAVAGVSIAAQLLINALIPPTEPKLDSGAVTQVYSIEGQSNNVKRYGTVPKVYGAHRMFPNVAANPYVELETNPSTGQLDQYLYCIYDFGLGPHYIDTLMIGDTPIQQFTDVQYSFVDPNRPTVSEGGWDDAYVKEFRLYKGDVEPENLGVVLEGNQNIGGPLDTYQAIRNSAENAEGIPQEISLTLANPAGLYGINSAGTVGSRSIDLEVYFSKVGEDNWKAYNDPTYVNEFLSVGGDVATQDIKLELLGAASSYAVLTNPAYPYPFLYQYGPSSFPDPAGSSSFWGAKYIGVYYLVHGIPAGYTKLVVKNVAGIDIGSPIRMNNRTISTITNIQTYSLDSSYVVLTLSSGMPEMIPMFVFIKEFTYPATYFAVQNDGSLSSGFAPKSFAVGKTNLGKIRITKASTEPTFATVKFSPKEAGQFKVRVTRVNTFGSYTTRTSDSLTWAGITTRFDRSPIQTTKRHTFLEIRIRATNQLNGSISNLSAVMTSIVPIWNGSAWTKGPSNNPAWIFADLMTGEVNKRAIPLSRLHTESLLEWANFCDEVPTPPPGQDFAHPRFGVNFVLDYESTLQEVLNQVTSAAQASLNIVDGKYGVLIDKRRTTPVQIFTPRNSRNFQSTRVYGFQPNGLKVKYISHDNSWKPSEVVLYDDGYNVNNSETFDELTAFGCTNNEQAWRYGRYMLAQNRLRQETMTIEVDFEYLVCTRGDYVMITQDVMLAGGYPARVKTFTPSNQFTIDDSLELSEEISYGAIFRSADGTINQVELEVVNAFTFNIVEPFDTAPEPGDLIVIGEMGEITFDCIVKAIHPNDDLSATLTLVEKADAIYDAESTTGQPVYDPHISTVTDPDFAPPGEVQDLSITANTWACNGAGYQYYIDLDWDTPSGSALEYYQIMVNYGRGYTEAGTTRDSEFRYIVDPLYLGTSHSFKVVAVSATGKKLDLGAITSVEATPLPKTTAPSNVENLSIDITNEVLQLSWLPVSDCDVQQYLIRYSPSTENVLWEATTPLLYCSKDQTLASTQARTGTYMIKAVDFAGNESASATSSITSIPNLFNLNIIETIDDFPDLEGTVDKAVKNVSDSTLTIQESVSGTVDQIEFYSEGFYYYQNLLDLGDIYTVRIQSQIQAEGFTPGDFMSNWTTLDSVQYLASSRYSEWDVELQYRATNELVFMSDWASMDSIDPIGGGSADDFAEWRTIRTIGDATGRIFQFRLRLISKKSSVTPRVFSGTIRADMPDRTEEQNNLLADVAADGVDVVYSTPFYGPGTSPNIQITVEDIQKGDTWVFSNKSLEGFNIKFYDENDNPVARTFDVSAKGYGRKNSSVI